MSVLSRRKFLGSAASASVIASQSCTNAPSETNAIRNHPLEGITRENLKITDVKVTLLSAPVPKEEQWFLNWMPERYVCWKWDAILVEVFTDQGITGIGGTCQYTGPERAKRYIEQRVKPALIGENPFDVELLTVGWGREAAGVDAALWDIIGKAKGLPVYELLAIDHEPDPHVRVYASAGEIYEGTVWPEDLIKEAFRYRDNGYDTFKFRTGDYWALSGMTIEKYTPIIEKLREAVGPDFNLIQEAGAGMGMNVDQWIEFAPKLEELKLLWVEAPFSEYDSDGVKNYKRLMDALPKVLVSGGEFWTNRAQFKPWLDSVAYDIINVDCALTGITEGWYISRMANLKGIKVCPHNWHGGLATMANANLMAGIPNGMICEMNQTYNSLKEGVFKEPLVAKNGYLDLPDKPGFGVELIDDIEKKFPFIPGRFDQPRQ